MNLQEIPKVLLVVICSLVIYECAPLAKDTLHYKITGKEICDWGCDSNIDEKLETCETVCHIDSQNINKVYDNEKQCQEVCAAKYIRCFQECDKSVNKKTSFT